MVLSFLKAVSLMEWVVIDLILLSPLAVFIKINLFILSCRLHRIGRRKILELEGCRHDLELLNKLRGLQNTVTKEGPFDDKTYYSFMDLHGEKNSNLDLL